MHINVLLGRPTLGGVGVRGCQELGGSNTYVVRVSEPGVCGEVTPDMLVKNVTRESEGVSAD